MDGKVKGAAILGVVLVALGSGCRKAEPPSAEQQAVARHESALRQTKQWREYFKKPEAAQTLRALAFLSDLDDNGQLPLVPKKDPKVLGVNLNMPVVSPKGPYYWSQAFHVILQDSPPRRCHYVVVQNYRDGGFQLQRAWRTDDTGKTVAEAPLVPPPVMGDPHWVYLGPMNPGAERAWRGWYNGTLGSGSVAIGTDDPASGLNCFVIGISNAAPGQTSHADIRSKMFPLRQSKAHGPFTLSFTYKLPTTVKPGDDIEVNLRFFGQGKENFLGQKTVAVGSSTGDSAMDHYKTTTVKGILAPRGAVRADVWITANIGGPWTSGAAEFDDFAVTAPAAPSWSATFARVGIFATPVGLLMGALLLKRSRKRVPP